MPPVFLQSKLQQNRDVLSVDINGDTVMLNPALSEYIRIDPIGAAIWQRLAQPMVVADLVSDLAKTYRGDREAIQADVLAFLEQFLEKELLIEVQ